MSRTKTLDVGKLSNSPLDKISDVKYTKIGPDMLKVEFPRMTWDSLLRNMGNESFIKVLKECPYKSYYFETPELSKNLDKSVIFMLVNSNTLHKRRADPSSFSDKLSGSGVFENLSRDATLIIPTNIHGKYNHLHSFMENASDEEIRDILQRSGDVVLKRTKEWENVYFSTSGDGVPWLHFRVSKTPKYYHSYEKLSDVYLIPTILHEINLISNIDVLKQIFETIEGVPTVWNGDEILKSVTEFRLTDKKLGEGRFNIVFEACFGSNCNFAWLKQGHSNLEDIWKYLYINKLMSDNYIGPKLYDYTIDNTSKKYVTIITEKLKQTLSEFLTARMKDTELVEWTKIKTVGNFKDFRIYFSLRLCFPEVYMKIIELFNHLHELGYTHNDLLTHNNNIMIDNYGNFKLIDFDAIKKEDGNIESRLLKIAYDNTSASIPMNISFDVSPYLRSSETYNVYSYNCKSSIITCQLVQYLRTASRAEEGSPGTLIHSTIFSKWRLCIWIEDLKRSPNKRVIFVGTVENTKIFNKEVGDFVMTKFFMGDCIDSIELDSLKPFYTFLLRGIPDYSGKLL